jgi:hypothetical protein
MSSSLASANSSDAQFQVYQKLINLRMFGANAYPIGIQRILFHAAIMAGVELVFGFTLVVLPSLRGIDLSLLHMGQQFRFLSWRRTLLEAAGVVWILSTVFASYRIEWLGC